MYIDWYSDFWQQNKTTVSLHIAVTIFIIPFEIVLFSVFTKKVYQCLLDSNFKKFLRLFILFVVFLMLLQTLYAWKEYLDNVLTPRIQMFIRQNYMCRMIPQNHDNYNQAEIMNQISYMPKNFYQNYDHVLRFWIPLFACFFFYTFFIFWNDWRIGIVTLLYFTAILIAFTYLVLCLGNFSNHVYEEGENLLQHYENVLYNDEAVRTYDTQNEEIERLNKMENDYNDEREKFILYTNLSKFGFLVFSISFMLFLFFYMFRKMTVHPKVYPSWKFIIFITILFFMLRFIITTMWYLPKTVQLYGSLQQLDTMDLKYPIDKDNITTNNVNTKDNNNTKNIVTSEEDFKNYDVSLNNVSFHYPTMTKNILENISLHIPYKSDILIKGRIGAGKSTIMRLLVRWYQPQKGSITLGGNSIYNIKHSLYSKLVYMMSQNTTLFSNRSVLENILYNSNKNISATELSNMFDLPKNFRDILHKEVLHHGMNISGGQKRLVHLLRCFFHPAKIFILDEPTDNLDEHLTKIVLKLIQKLQQNHTVICISHDHRVETIFSNVFYM